jgi:hypothetical protein
VADLLANRVFMAGFTGWFIAQFAKVRGAELSWHWPWPAWRVQRRRLDPSPPRHAALQIFTRRFKTGKWDVRAIVDSGGMPSSHSALCSVSGSGGSSGTGARDSRHRGSAAGSDRHSRAPPAAQGVTTSVALQHGLSSSLFAAALCFSVIVMYDAAGVRRHAGARAPLAARAGLLRLQRPPAAARAEPGPSVEPFLDQHLARLPPASRL